MVDKDMLKKRCLDEKRRLRKKHFPFCYMKMFDIIHIDNTNCFAYVLNQFITSNHDGRYSYLGWTEFDENAYYTEEDAEKMMILDFNNLGFKVKKLKKEPKVKNNRINFAFFVGITAGKEDGDFHFVRQNLNGKWSHKLGYGGEVEYFKNSFGKYCSPHESDFEEVKFVGYYQAWRSNK